MNDNSPDKQPAADPAPLPSPRVRRRRWWILALAFLLVFAGGFVTGGAGAMFVAFHRIQQVIQNPKEVPHRVTERLRRKLGLTDEQTRQVEAILQQHQEKLEALRTEMAPRMREHFDAMEEEIAAVLTEEQAREWREHFRDFQRRWLPPPPPPHGPPGPPGRGGPPR